MQLPTIGTSSANLTTQRGAGNSASATGTSNTETPEPDQSGVPDGDSDEQPSETDAQPEESADTLPLDQVFEILENARRRTVLRYLKDSEGSVKLGELAEHVAAVENDIDVAAVTSEQRKRVYVGLYQCHLPKMDDMNIVDFNQNRGIIDLDVNASQLDTYLETSTDESPQWHRFYAGIAGIGVLLLAASFAGAASMGLTPAVAFGIFNVALIGGCLYHFNAQ